MWLLVTLLLACLGDAKADGFLANWMGKIEPVIANRTLLDLSLPGTHDTLTYDLSRTVSDRANDINPTLAWVLHKFNPIFPFVTTFVREQAQTQKLDIVSQLDSGVRFLDMRIILTDAPNVNGQEWYGIHFLETHKTVLTYLKQVRGWLDAHPKEVIVMWFSRHGGECNKDNGFPDVSHSDMQRFWGQVEEVFKGLMLDTRASQANTTTYSQLLQRNHRVVAYVTDYAHFTNNSPRAYDACMIKNEIGSNDIDKIPQGLSAYSTIYKNAHSTLATTKKQNHFWLKSMAVSSPDAQVKGAALIHFLFDKFATKKCAKAFHIPGMDDWCPPTLLDVSQLRAYYNQFILETTIRNVHQGWGFPNAIYLDAVDVNGVIHTGSSTDWSKKDHYYCYADTLILYNIITACQAHSQGACDPLAHTVMQRRAANPFHVWDDASRGRHSGWPVKL